MHPTATILKCEKLGEILRTTLELDELPPSPIAPASLWLQDTRSTKVLDVHKLVQRIGNQLTLNTYNYQASLLNTGSRYDFITWWRPDQLQLAQDTTRNWQLQEFSPKPNWDHEHCFLCFQRISRHEDEEPVAYTDEKAWLCQQCYHIYVATGFGATLGE